MPTLYSERGREIAEPSDGSPVGLFAVIFGKGREDVLPDEVEFFLHVAEVGGDSYDGVLLGHHEDILSLCAVGTESVVAALHI